MPSGLAAVVCAAGILGLFLLDRDRTSRTSPALWVPAAWLAIAAARDISQWFNTVLVTDSPDQLLEGSPVDRVIYAGLLVAGLVVLVSRAERARSLLRANWPLIVFFLFCAISVLWSDYPFVAFKRWTKALGNLVMVLVVLTERDPPAAVRQLLTRTGFLLIPLSVLLIKYFPEAVLADGDAAAVCHPAPRAELPAELGKVLDEKDRERDQQETRARQELPHGGRRG